MQEQKQNPETPTSPTTRRQKRKELLKKMSTEYENRGLVQVNVDNQQVAAIHTENNRERNINESLLKDIELLK